MSMILNVLNASILEVATCTYLTVHDFLVLKSFLVKILRERIKMMHLDPSWKCFWLGSFSIFSLTTTLFCLQLVFIMGFLYNGELFMSLSLKKSVVKIDLFSLFCFD